MDNIMAPPTEEVDLAILCEYSDHEMKHFWCKHFKDDVSFLVASKTEDLLAAHCYNISSSLNECLGQNYRNSTILECDQTK